MRVVTLGQIQRLNGSRLVLGLALMAGVVVTGLVLWDIAGR